MKAISEPNQYESNLMRTKRLLVLTVASDADWLSAFTALCPLMNRNDSSRAATAVRSLPDKLSSMEAA
jgi:hypothetical protein